MMRVQYDCDACGAVAYADLGGEDGPIIPEGWIEVAVRRRVVNDEWQEQAAAQGALVEHQMTLAFGMAEQQGAVMTDEQKAQTREVIEMDTSMKAPVTAPENIDEEDVAHYCAKDAERITKLVIPPKDEDEDAESGAS